MYHKRYYIYIDFVFMINQLIARKFYGYYYAKRLQYFKKREISKKHCL